MYKVRFKPVFAEADLDTTTIAVPDHIQGIFEVPHWTVRWVLLHIIASAELAKMVPPLGLEPRTCGLKVRSSTN